MIGAGSDLQVRRGLLAVLLGLAAVGQTGCVHVLGDFEVTGAPDAGSVMLMPEAAAPDMGIVDAAPPPPDGACGLVGTEQCQGDALFICESGGNWKLEVTCPSLCENAACVGMCKPG